MLDEPTTGLHFDDIAKLMRALRKLLDAGHSLLVIEHNLDVIRASDWLIDLGPEGGDAGGEVVAHGTPEDVMLHATSHTGQALREYAAAMGVVHVVDEPSVAYVWRARRGWRCAGKGEVNEHVGGAGAIQIVNAKEHNLKSLSVDIPRGKFNVVTGVSGSGKSTLAFDILFNEGQRRYLESLNAYARSPSCNRRGGPRWMRCMAFRPRWPSSSGCRAVGASPRWARPPRSGISCACCM